MKKLLYIITLILFISSCQEKEDSPKFWVWMNANEKLTTEEWNSAFQKLDDVGIEGVLIGSNKKVIETVIPIADKYKIEVQIPVQNSVSVTKKVSNNLTSLKQQQH